MALCAFMRLAIICVRHGSITKLGLCAAGGEKGNVGESRSEAEVNM